MDRCTRHAIARFSGLAGAMLMAVSLLGVVTTQLTAGTAERRLAPSASSTQGLRGLRPTPGAGAAAPAASTTTAPAVSEVTSPSPPLHYPLQVGRYWVYRYREPGSDVTAEVERLIVRREVRREGDDLFIFDDGGVAYFEQGRVYEMGPSGGVNIIPVDGAAPPVVYRSQGLQIEKWVGAADTTLEVGGRRFTGCLEVVTRFRRLEGSGGPARTVSYSSFYAPGIGLVGRQSWPRDDKGSLAVILTDHGTRPL